jgi:molybdopterin synthase catalytic subunit
MEVELSYNSISEERLLDTLEAPEVGAQVVFKGIVRNHHQGRKVQHLYYEAYEAMALKAMEELGETVRKQFEIYDIVLAHRLGRLEIGQIAVLIAVTSAHRGVAFSACQYAIDELKKHIPIWKKEVYEEGSAWLANAEALNPLPSPSSSPSSSSSS